MMDLKSSFLFKPFMFFFFSSSIYPAMTAQKNFKRLTGRSFTGFPVDVQAVGLRTSADGGGTGKRTGDPPPGRPPPRRVPDTAAVRSSSWSSAPLVSSKASFRHYAFSSRTPICLRLRPLNWRFHKKLLDIPGGVNPPFIATRRLRIQKESP